VPVIAPAQFNKQAESRGLVEPPLIDLRGCRAVQYAVHRG